MLRFIEIVKCLENWYRIELILVALKERKVSDVSFIKGAVAAENINHLQKKEKAP